MKTISIITFWGVPNYGAFAQAYALNRIITNLKSDYEVKHFAYLHPKHIKLYYKKSCPKISRFLDLISPYYYKRLLYFLFHNRNIYYPNFKNDWDKIPHIKVKNPAALEKIYSDIIVTGSDCIWEFSIKDFGDDVHLIGNRLKCKKLVAYACSFGDMNPSDDFPNFVKTGLQKYDFISVRDKTTQDIVCQQTGKEQKDIPLVLDPTLLYDFQHDGNIEKPKRKNYILVYGHRFSDTTIKQVKEYAKEHSLTIIGAGLCPGWVDEKWPDITPLEWIGLFANAAFVVTCTFHGLMFSINYQRKVYFNQAEYVKNRSTWLLQQLGLYDLYQNEPSLNQVLEYNWDYHIIQKKLDLIRQPSLDFLKRNLGDE